MTNQVLRGETNTQGSPATLAVHTAQSRLSFHVGKYAAGTLYLRTVGGARVNGVAGLRHGPEKNTPHGELRDFTTAVSFTADGSAEIDLVGKEWVHLVPTTTETGGSASWTVEAWLSVQGDAP